MQEMREVRGLRERTREQIRSSKASAAHEIFSTTTRSRGIERSRIESLDGSTIRYL